MSEHRNRLSRDCLRCGRYRRHKARGLCFTCHRNLTLDGRIEDYPRLTWRREDLLAEWDHLRKSGVDINEAARRIGISRGGLEKAIERGWVA